mmetsp:Transcript_32158/g.63686  ORF Transcript_32158/g.63686 Transcript_32158/m.63686 type:complete len:624 (+) Transcript_32158:624-2495(+)
MPPTSKEKSANKTTSNHANNSTKMTNGGAASPGSAGNTNSNTATTTSTSTEPSTSAAFSSAMTIKVDENSTLQRTTSAPPNKSETASVSHDNEPLSQAERKAREMAWRASTTEDQRRMRFLALLCGRGAFSSNNNGVSSVLNMNGRERSNSIGGMGASIAVNGQLNISATSLDEKQRVGSSKSQHQTNDYQQDEFPTNQPNYQPTTPQNLSRRVLNRQGVGYLDDAVSLITSALSDRFLATVLVQAMACRDRRIEGNKAKLSEMKARKRHQRRVFEQRRRRDKKMACEKGKRRRLAEESVADAENIEREGPAASGSATATSQTKKKPSATSAKSSTAAKSSISIKSSTLPSGGTTDAVNGCAGPLFQLTDAQKEKVTEFQKQEADIDAEEDYYHSYLGKKAEDSDVEEGKDNHGVINSEPDDDANEYEEFEEDEESDEEEEDEDEQHYDLLLRDLVRPLSAWGFDLTGKLGFDVRDHDDGDAEESAAEDANAEEGEAEVEEEEEEEDGAENEEDEDGELTMMSDEEGGAKAKESPDKKSSPVKPKKKAATTKKKATAKRKRNIDEDESSGSNPMAKKAATTNATADDKSTAKNSTNALASTSSLSSSTPTPAPDAAVATEKNK